MKFIPLFYFPWIATCINTTFGFFVTTVYVILHYKYKNKILNYIEIYIKNNLN